MPSSHDEKRLKKLNYEWIFYSLVCVSVCVSMNERLILLLTELQLNIFILIFSHVCQFRLSELLKVLLRFKKIFYKNVFFSSLIVCIPWTGETVQTFYLFQFLSLLNNEKTLSTDDR